MKTLLSVIAIILFPASCFATADEEPEKVSVEIRDKSEGAIGERLIYKVKECFRKSSRFVESKKGVPRLVVFINTMDVGEKGNAQLTVYSLVWTLIREDGSLPLHLNNTVGYSGTSVLNDAAEGVIAMTDKLMDELTFR